MFIGTKPQVRPSVALLQGPRDDQATSDQSPVVVESDDGLVHNHNWANDRRDGLRVAAPRSGMVVADASSIPTPSSALHDDVHYA